MPEDCSSGFKNSNALNTNNVIVFVSVSVCVAWFFIHSNLIKVLAFKECLTDCLIQVEWLIP